MAKVMIKDLVESKELSSNEMAGVHGGRGWEPKGWDYGWEKPRYDYGYQYTIGDVTQSNDAHVNISDFSLGNNVAVIGHGSIEFGKVAPNVEVDQTNKAFS